MKSKAISMKFVSGSDEPAGISLFCPVFCNNHPLNYSLAHTHGKKSDRDI